MSGKKTSIGKFKCCSDGKDLTCYYCVSCENILHRSCVERKKSTIYIGDHRIYCSGACQANSLDQIASNDDLIHELKEITTTQQNQIKELKNALQSQRRNSVAFESDAAEAEEEYKKQIEEHQRKITRLKEKLTEQTKKAKKIYDVETEKKQLMENQYKRTVDEWKKRNDQLEEKIISLKEQSTKYRDEETEYMKTILSKDAEIEELRQKLAKLSETKLSEELRQKESEIGNLMAQLTMMKNHSSTEQKWKNLEQEITEENKKRIANLESLVHDLKSQLGNEKRNNMANDIEYREKVVEMKAKIGRLQISNDNLKQELKKLQEKKRQTDKELPKPRINISSQKISSDQKKTPKKHINDTILFLGGKNFYNIGKIFKSVTSTKFDTISQYTESNFVEDIVKLHEPYTRKPSKPKYIIIFTTNENARKGRKVVESTIKSLQTKSVNTNIIVVGAPMALKRPILNRLTNEQNQRIKTIIGKSSTLSFVDISNVVKPTYTGGNGELTNKGKFLALKYIFETHIDKKQKTTGTIDDETREAERYRKEQANKKTLNKENKISTNPKTKAAPPAFVSDMINHKNNIPDQVAPQHLSQLGAYSTDFLYPNLRRMDLVTQM